MRIERIITDLGLLVLNPEKELAQKEVSGCYIGDLLSNVMGHAVSGDLWLTVQTHQNVVAVAVLLNLAGIVFVEGHLPGPDIIEKANTEGLVLLSTQQTAYDLAGQLFTLGLRRSVP